MNRTVLITGATDGIGLALAHLYAQQGARLILVGRRPLTQLDLSFFTADSYVQADLALADAPRQICDFLSVQRIEELHTLIHNAGIGYVGDVSTQAMDNIAQLVSVNLQTPAVLTQLLLPHLRRGRGKLVFVSSVATAMATPDYAVYTASKAALNGFVRNLRIELGEDVPTLVIHAGATQTGIHRKSGADVERMNWRRFPSAESVAARIVALVEGNRRQATIGLTNQLLWRIGHLFGTWMDRLQIRMGR